MAARPRPIVPPPIPAGAEPLHIIIDAPTTAAERGELTKAEYAVEAQVNAEVRAAWHTPPIYFSATNGWPVHITTPAAVTAMNPVASAVHAWQNNAPAIYIGWRPGLFLSALLSHETIEALVNPQTTATNNGWLLEPCDPTNADYTGEYGMRLYDFVLPSWFADNSAGPWDQMATMTHAGEVRGSATRLVSNGWVTVG